MHHEKPELPVDFVTQVAGAATTRLGQLDAWLGGARFGWVRLDVALELGVGDGVGMSWCWLWLVLDGCSWL